MGGGDDAGLGGDIGVIFGSDKMDLHDASLQIVPSPKSIKSLYWSSPSLPVFALSYTRISSR